MKHAIFAVMAAALALPANAVTITSLASGTDGAGMVLPGNSADALYTVQETSTAAIVVANPAGTWLPNNATSKWVWQNGDGQPVNVTRTFRVSFDTTGFVLGSVAAAGRWSTDNDGLDILLNGVSTGNTCAGFTAWCNFTIGSGFASGVNTLDFVVRDRGVISGFRAEGAVTGNVVPEPATWAMLIVGFGLVGSALRRRQPATI